jgi:STE24 endopeptidase
MNATRLLVGLCTGFAAGYVAVRSIEALAELLAPSPLCERDRAAYARVRRAEDAVGAFRSVATAVAVAGGPLAHTLDRATLRLPVAARPAAFALACGLAGSIAELPVAFASDYALERRYGLSERSAASWFADYFKSGTVSIAVTMLFATLFGWAVRRAPAAWPRWAAAGTLPLFVAGNVVVPLFVMPLFNAFVPLDGPLERRLRSLATRLGVGSADILRMDMSRQTRKANAFVTGIGRTHRIVLGDTLIDGFTEDEIVFVVAHEIGHYRSKDTWRLIAIGEALAAVLFWTAQRCVSRPQRNALLDRPLLVARYYAAMVAASQVLRPLLFAFSRSREWAADRYAVEATGDARSGAAAMRRLAERNLSDPQPPRWYEIWFGSHPSPAARVAALERAGSIV